MEEVWKGVVNSFDESTAIYLIFKCGGTGGWPEIDSLGCSCNDCDEACADEAWVPERADERYASEVPGAVWGEEYLRVSRG
jgi:hypothetical protein